MSYLPAGVTESMCEPYDPKCGRCGHFYSDHYEERDKEVIPDKCKRDSESYYLAVELLPNGEVGHACDAYTNTKTQCDCIKFMEGSYEREYEREYEDD